MLWLTYLIFYRHKNHNSDEDRTNKMAAKIWYPRLPPLQEKVNRTLWATILKSVFLELLNHLEKALLESSLAVTLQNVLGLCQYQIKGGTSIELSLTYDIMGIWMKVFPPPKLQTRLNPRCFIGLYFFLVCIFYGSAIQDGHQA